MKKSDRYIYDSLYGEIYLPDFVWELFTVPELQRLREIRLCNINSLCLTGGANVNRFEHALGTCFLATVAAESWLFRYSVSESELKIFFTAALFHDVLNMPFGHTFEYIEESENYKPEADFVSLALGRKTDYTYVNSPMEPVFFGAHRKLYSVLRTSLKLSEENIVEIGDAIKGKGKFGPLISNSMDLDNIDNVYRLAYHIGLKVNKMTPILLAQNMRSERGELVIDEDKLHLIEDWHITRKNLYNLLLLNPEEFSGKCMLTEAIENVKMRGLRLKWFYTDYQMLVELSRSTSENENIIGRLMTGDLYGCIGIYSTKKIGLLSILGDTQERIKIEKSLSNGIRDLDNSHLNTADIAIHVIKDVNKTERPVQINIGNQEYRKVGGSLSRLLIGVFFKNKDLNMRNAQRGFFGLSKELNTAIYEYLVELLGDKELDILNLYGEVNR